MGSGCRFVFGLAFKGVRMSSCSSLMGFIKLRMVFKGFSSWPGIDLYGIKTYELPTSTFSMCDSHRSTEIVTVLSTNIAFDKFSFFCPTVVVACFFVIFLQLSPSPILFWKSRLLVLIRGSLCQVEVHIPMAVEWKPISCC